MVPSEQGENVGKGPGEKRNKMAQGRCSQCWGSLLGTVGTTVRGPGSSHCLCPTCQTSCSHSYRHPPSSHPAITSELMPPLKSASFHPSSHSSFLQVPFVWWSPFPQNGLHLLLQRLPGLQTFLLHYPSLSCTRIHAHQTWACIFFSYPGPITCLLLCWCSISTRGAEKSWRSSNSRAETCLTSTGQAWEDGDMNGVEER